MPRDDSAQPTLTGRWLVLFCLSLLMGYTWFMFISTDLKPLWQHWLGLFGLIAVILINSRYSGLGMVVIGLYTLISIFGVFAFYTSVTLSTIRIGPLPIPLGQLMAWPFFIAQVVINIDPLIYFYLAWKDPVHFPANNITKPK